MNKEGLIKFGLILLVSICGFVLLYTDLHFIIKLLAFVGVFSGSYWIGVI